MFNILVLADILIFKKLKLFPVVKLKSNLSGLNY